MLDSDERWQRVAATWDEANRIAASPHMSCPFDAAGKARLLKALSDAPADLNALVESALLSEAEAALVKTELAELATAVDWYRPTEIDCAMVLCYDVSYVPPYKQGIENLVRRLPLLEKMAASEVLDAAVTARILETVARDVDSLAVGRFRSLFMSRVDRKQAKDLRAAALVQVERIKVRLTSSGQGR